MANAAAAAVEHVFQDWDVAVPPPHHEILELIVSAILEITWRLSYLKVDVSKLFIVTYSISLPTSLFMKIGFCNVIETNNQLERLKVKTG